VEWVWVKLGIGLASLALGLSYLGPHRRGEDRAWLSPRFNMILNLVVGGLFVIWAVVAKKVLATDVG
jgi:hypothetical protein